MAVRVGLIEGMMGKLMAILRFQKLLPAALILSLVMPISAAAVMPEQLYGASLTFDIYREATEIGTHHVKFRRDGDEVVVESQSKIAIKLLFLTAYSFDYASTARWRGDQLLQLKVRVDDNGAKLAFESMRDQTGVYRTMLGGEETLTPAPLFPTNHWNKAALGQARLLNTLTGGVDTVTISSPKVEPIKTEKGIINANRYDLSGGVETTLWYDRDGRWVGMRFIGRDGTPVEYRCRQCQGRPPS